MKIKLTGGKGPQQYARLQLRVKAEEFPQVEALRERGGHPDFSALLRAALAYYAEHAPEFQDAPKK